MPMDRATQESVGLNGLPDWYIKSNGISLRPQPQVAHAAAINGHSADKSWRSREAEIGGLRAGLSSREFGIRPAVAAAPNRKLFPATRQLQGPLDGMDSLASQIDARTGNVPIEGSVDCRAMTPGLSDLGMLFGPEIRRDFGAIGDRLTLSTKLPNPTRKVGSGSGLGGYGLPCGKAEQQEKKLDGAANLDEDSYSDYLGGITQF